MPGAQKFRSSFIRTLFSILMSYIYSSICKQCSNNLVHIYISLCHVPLSVSRAYICEGLTLKFRDDIRDLMDLRETQAGGRASR